MVRSTALPAVSMFATILLTCLGSQAPALASCGTGDAPAASGDCGGFGGLLPGSVTNERIAARTGDKAWVPDKWQSAPFMIKESAPTYTVRTSLSHLFTYDIHRRLARTGLAESGLTPDQVAQLAKSATARPPVDLWTTFDVGREIDEGLLRGSFGADVTLGRSGIVGIAVERGELENGDDERVVTYFKRRIATGLSWRVAGGWGHGIIDTAASEGNVQNGYLSAGLQSAWMIDGVTFTPSAEVTTNLGRLENDGDTRDWSDSQLVFAQRLSRSFVVDDGGRLEPFLVITQSIDVDNGTPSEQGLEGGLKIGTKDLFSLHATTGMKRSEEAGETDISGKVQLKVPFN